MNNIKDFAGAAFPWVFLGLMLAITLTNLNRKGDETYIREGMMIGMALGAAFGMLTGYSMGTSIAFGVLGGQTLGLLKKKNKEE